MGAWCQSPKFKNKGCPGIKENKYTLSQTGHPCYWDHSNRNCAFCAPQARTYQCGSKADPDSGDNHCVSEAGGTASDCDAGRFIPDCHRMGRGICDINAECKKTPKKLDEKKYSHLYECRCKPGWRNTALMPGKKIGTGLTCVDNDGNFSQDPALSAALELVVTNDFYVFPADSSEFPTGPSAENMFSQMGNWLNTGGCPAAQACNVTTFA